MQRAQILRELVLDSRYVIDEQLVAAAVLARGVLRGSVADVAFRNDVRVPSVRSFRPSRQARSFRPCNIRSQANRRVRTLR